ncbi:MAG: sigma-70 family RNA polymerase sigma factor [Blastocatellia bacterium]
MSKTSALNESPNPELSPEKLQAFLAWLASGSDTSDAPDKAYESARRRLTIFFAGRKCLDPESLADQTLDLAMRKLAEIPAEASPMAYLIGIAKNIYRDELRATRKLELVRSEVVTLHSPEPENEDRHTCLEKCLTELPAEERAMVLGYYSESKQAKIDRRKQLADLYGLSLNALRNRVFRLNQRLALCVTSCMENFTA